MKKPALRHFTLSLRTLVAVLGLGLVFGAPCVKAQSKTEPKPQPAAAAPVFDATHLHGPAALDGATWMLHAGDDPAYARPDFDDSNWVHFDLHKSLKTLFPHSHPVIVWYRLHVKVPPDQAGLSLECVNVAAAFELYTNGQRIIQSGKVAPFESSSNGTYLLAKVPEAQVGTGTIVIALRTYILPVNWDQPETSDSVHSLTLGQEDMLRDLIWVDIIGNHFLNWVNSFAGLGLGFVALALFIAQPRRREYLWIFLYFFTSALGLPFIFYKLFHDVSISWDLANSSFAMASFIFMTLMYFAFLRIPFGRWIQAILAIAIFGFFCAWLGISKGTFGLMWAYLGFAPFILLYAVVFPVLFIIHFRRGNREAGILLVPVTLYSLTLYVSILLGLLSQIHAFAHAVGRLTTALDNLRAGPFNLQFSNFSDLLFVLSLAIIIVLRSTRMSRQQAELEGEIAAAREVQQVLVPEAISALPGFTLTSAYRPAKEVGGDFFQIIPLESGSTLVVLGDVSGKGLKAAMAVSLIVGAIRTVAETTASPAEILACLNRRLYGRLNGGFSTAIAMRLDADGECAIASAGHPAPFLNDREIDLPGALPLGVEPAVTYAESFIALGATDRLALYTDGLPEARNATGELYSFDRLKALFAANPSAAQATDAAVDFGQEDDITVVTLTRLAIGEESTAVFAAPTFAPA